MSELRRIAPVALRSLGRDERWLQDKIADDPTLLGLGELEIAAREHPQPVGGRIDFLMRDSENETYYEVEVMLGRLDETHIIRTIEYWDIERQRRPKQNHRAVIVAEQITSRFFNVIRLLNRATPIIAVQLTAFQLDDGSIGLFPVKVLDIIEEIDESELDPVERADRLYWQQKVDPRSLAVVDHIESALKSADIEPRLTYNRHHIAMGTTGYNFCWFHPRRTPGHCHIEFRANDGRDDVLTKLQDAGIDASPRGTRNVGFGATKEEIENHTATIVEALKGAEKQSRG